MKIYKFTDKSDKTKVLIVGSPSLTDAEQLIKDVYGKSNSYVNYENVLIDDEIYIKTLDICEYYLNYPRFISNSEYDKMFNKKKSKVKIERKVFDHSEEKNNNYNVYNWNDKLEADNKIKNDIDPNSNILQKLKKLITKDR